MAKSFARIRDRLVQKRRRYRNVRKDKDELRELIFNNNDDDKNRSDQESPEMKRVSCTDWLRSDSRRTAKNSQENLRIEKDLGSTEITDVNDFQEIGEVEIAEKEDCSQAKPPLLERRRSSAFQRLKNWVKPENRRDAICEQMEREIETSGVSLRQYRKFLATTYILHDLKML